MSLAQYTIIKQIAPAIYGKVLLCKDNTTMSTVAVKCISTIASNKKRSIKGNHAVYEDFNMEKKIMRQLSKCSHPNVLKLLNDFYENGNDHLVLEYCSNGELFDLICNCPNGKLNKNKTKEYFYQIVNAVSFMHQQGIAHCDLSLENILVDSNGQCKLCDFGLAVDINNKRQNAVGKFFYMAPEMYYDNYFQPGPADMWSLGIMLFIMMTGTPLFKKANDDDSTFDYFKTNGLECMLRWWKMDHLFNDDLFYILDHLLEIDPLKRMTMKQLLATDFLQKPVN